MSDAPYLRDPYRDATWSDEDECDPWDDLRQRQDAEWKERDDD